MNDQLTFQYHKFTEAVRILATHRGDIKSRLKAAAPWFMMLNPGVLPEDVQTYVTDIRNKLTEYPSNERFTAVQVTTNKIRTKKAAEITAEIWNAYHMVSEYFYSLREEQAET